MDILIKDFQRHRDNQELFNKEVLKHSTGEDKVQEKILTTLKWHTVIGTGMVASIAALWLRVAGI